MPTHEHVLETQNKELDRIFWEIVNSPEEVKQDIAADEEE